MTAKIVNAIEQKGALRQPDKGHNRGRILNIPRLYRQAQPFACPIVLGRALNALIAALDPVRCSLQGAAKLKRDAARAPWRDWALLPVLGTNPRTINGEQQVATRIRPLPFLEKRR